jgi:exonuclease III
MTTATWNNRGINQKMSEIISELKKIKIDIIVLSETKKKSKGTEEMDDYIFIWSVVEEEKRAAADVLRKKLTSRIIGYSWISERITTMNGKTGRSHCYIIGAYSPTEGKVEETETFYKQCQESFYTAG